MITLNQAMRKARKGKLNKRVAKIKNQIKMRKGLGGQRGGILSKRTTVTPKKPNSAIRKVGRVTLNDGIAVLAYLPGEKNAVTEYSRVLIRAGRRKDLPGVKWIAIPGSRDAPSIEGRKQRRSLYGAKKPK